MYRQNGRIGERYSLANLGKISLFLVSFFFIFTVFLLNFKVNASDEYTITDPSNNVSSASKITKALQAYCVPKHNDHPYGRNAETCGSIFEAKYYSKNNCGCFDENLVYDKTLRRCKPKCAPGAYVHQVSKCPGGTSRYKMIRSDDYAVMCKDCGAGTYGIGGDSCIRCSVGSYQAEKRKSSCDTCPAGYKCATEGLVSPTECSAGTYSKSGASNCSNCSAGTYSGARASSCSTCSAGTYSGAGAASCTECSDGTWAKAGSGSCESCLNQGVKTCDKKTGDATSCNTNFYLTQKMCKSCLSEGVASCDSVTGKATSCIAGYGFNSAKGTCTICYAGTYSAGGTASCSSCPIGTYSNINASSCATCSDATYSSWSASCGSATRTKTTYCTIVGSNLSTANPSNTTETKDMGGCGAHQYCDGSCKACSKPANSSWSDNSSCSWTCNTGYAKNGNSCTACSKPANSSWTSGCSWSCNSGYTKSGNSCERNCVKGGSYSDIGICRCTTGSSGYSVTSGYYSNSGSETFYSRGSECYDTSSSGSDAYGNYGGGGRTCCFEKDPSLKGKCVCTCSDSSGTRETESDDLSNCHDSHGQYYECKNCHVI